VDLPDLELHRQQLAAQFERLTAQFGPLQVSDDNDFRLTDWTFDVAGLDPQTLARMDAFCQDQGWSFCYSNVQCHIKPVGQDKAPGLRHLLSDRWPDLLPAQVLTVGDSPNDASLFDPAFFPCSAGVANVAHYRDVLPHLPRWVTGAPEADGFRELAAVLAPVAAAAQG
jgi:hydroxymethylpyrimidine pyrophosphatase-like HAD family hydrolase